jgi:hypothetical protein
VWDSKTKRILLVAADYTPPPAPGGRGQMVADSFSIVVVSK